MPPKKASKELEVEKTSMAKTASNALDAIGAWIDEQSLAGHFGTKRQVTTEVEMAKKRKKQGQ